MLSALLYTLIGLLIILLACAGYVSIFGKETEQGTRAFAVLRYLGWLLLGVPLTDKLVAAATASATADDRDRSVAIGFRVALRLPAGLDVVLEGLAFVGARGPMASSGRPFNATLGVQSLAISGAQHIAFG